jgi:hypothetical protein
MSPYFTSLCSEKDDDPTRRRPAPPPDQTVRRALGDHRLVGKPEGARGRASSSLYLSRPSGFILRVGSTLERQFLAPVLARYAVSVTVVRVSGEGRIWLDWAGGRARTREARPVVVDMAVR